MPKVIATFRRGPPNVASSATGYEASGPAVTERPRDASLASIVQYVERNLLLLAVRPLQICRCRKLNSVLFCSVQRIH